MKTGGAKCPYATTSKGRGSVVVSDKIMCCEMGSSCTHLRRSLIHVPVANEHSIQNGW